MSEHVPQEPPLLSGRARAFAGLAGFAILALAIGLLLTTVEVRAAAPSCTDGPPGCVVVVDQTINFAVPLALAAVACLLLLAAVTGHLWQVAFGDNILKPDRPEVTQVTDDEVEKTTAADPASAANVAQPASGTQFAELYAKAPDVAQALDEVWRDWYGESVADRLMETRRGSGKGNHSWYLRAVNPNDIEEWVRVSKGGRGGGLTTSRAR